jgi:hypothetical protein
MLDCHASGTHPYATALTVASSTSGTVAGKSFRLYRNRLARRALRTSTRPHVTSARPTEWSTETSASSNRCSRKKSDTALHLI